MSTSGKELLPDLQQLLKYLEPTFRDVAFPGSNTSIEDILRNLEETDENFHRCITFTSIICTYRRIRIFLNFHIFLNFEI